MKVRAAESAIGAAGAERGRVKKRLLDAMLQAVSK